MSNVLILDTQEPWICQWVEFHETSDGASLARNELHASLPLATDAPIISAFLLVCSRVNRESLAKYKFLKRYDAEKKLHCMKLQLIVV